LRKGDWRATIKGNFFHTEKVETVDLWPSPFTSDIVRRWDLGATEPDPDNPDPDYTVGLKASIVDGTMYIIDMVRFRLDPGGTDKIIKDTAERDGIEVRIVMEQEPGASGKRDISHMRRALSQYSFQGKPSTGDKLVRARPVASWMNQGFIKMVRGSWNKEFLAELQKMGPQTYNKPGYHDDIMDALSGAHQDLAKPDYTPLTAYPGIAAEQEQEFF